MSIARYEIAELPSDKNNQVIDLAPVAEAPPEEISAPQALSKYTPPEPPATYDPNLKIGGWRERWRATQIVWTFALYHIFLYAYHRGWFIGKKNESEEKHLQWQAEWLHARLIKLGPTFIKIGQAVATRADLLPLAYIKEFTKLQDNVPRFPNEVAMEIIERELGFPIPKLFASIDPEPIAAASLGQVYCGRLHSGAEVAIKVQRPDLADTINLDLAVLRRIATFMNRYPKFVSGIDWQGTIKEFADVIFEELDYYKEANNAEVFRQNFSKWNFIHVPQIYWSHSSSRVLTMEFIHGTKVLELEELKARGIEPKEIIKLMSKTYLKQLLEDGFFHADPHPGNIRVMPDGRLAFFDFGMVGRIPNELQTKMIDAFFHLVEKDVNGLVQDLINLDFLPHDVDVEEMRPVIADLFKNYFNLKLGEIRFKELTYEMAEIMYKYPFRLPPNFTYIIRALMTLEGIGIVMDPNFSFFDVAKPFAKEFMLKREGKYIRDQLLKKIIYGEGGDIQWDKTWKLIKMGAKMYWNSWFGKSEAK